MMYVQVEIKLDTNSTAVHQKAMLAAARSLTNDTSSVHIVLPENKKEAITAIFTIEKARQIDVVDKIGKAFHFVDDYSDSTIWFPKKAPRWYQPTTAKKITSRQGQYLAFIYYYTKINGRSPAERDMQNYFKVTPPAVHNMVLELEKRELISRVPRQPRSIKLLVSRAEIPDLA